MTVTLGLCLVDVVEIGSRAVGVSHVLESQC
jgi:hypothetical protein